MQVQDELVFEVKEGQVNDLIAAVKQRMQNVAGLKVPLIVKAEAGVIGIKRIEAVK
nr:hypothetical protein [uncultured Halomonas sp.]